MTRETMVRPGWEPSLDENETPWMVAGATIAVLAVGAWAGLVLVAGAADRLVEWLMG